MNRYFNTEGICEPSLHYMVSLEDRLEKTSFKEETSFSKAFAEILEKAFQTAGTKYFKSCPIQEKSVSALSDCTSLRTLFKQISHICKILPVPVVLMIDEADSASDNQIFTDFLSMLRGYYLEAQTRDAGRTDVIIDYLGCQYIVEMKIWHGNEYNKRGELQLLEYLNYFHLQKGYLLSFNFNKSKETGIKTIRLNDRIIIEAVV